MGYRFDRYSKVKTTFGIWASTIKIVVDWSNLISRFFTTKLNKNKLGASLLIGAYIFVGCQKSKDPDKPFEILTPEKTGVHFNNIIASTDSLNILNYIYFYNGGGVGIGDINNDGLEDIFFSGNQVTSRLYLNQGDMSFDDITIQSGLETNQWCTGVSMVDINTDGYLDIYLSVAGSPEAYQRSNLLFINNGDKTFTELASEYGIANTDYSTHSAFFDYDRDGDLDLYVLNHANERDKLNTPLPKNIKGGGASTDKLYRNNGDLSFTDVSIATGISIEGYGLGLAISDIDLDGWPDIYVSNDFISNDLLYINNSDGTFSNQIASSIQEQSYNGMGNDVGDFNNDGIPDIVVVDMLPPDPVREKTMAGSMTLEKFQVILKAGYEPQYVRNTLQLNRGGLEFEEIGRYAGISRTDWSWSPLLADFDNDGWKDLFISNGYLKDITDKDFIDYNLNLSMFKSKEEADKETLLRIEKLDGVKLSNFFFRNNHDLTFSNLTNQWGLEKESYSNGAAYSDLDNDGDLDLVISNLNDKAFIIENKNDNTGNYFQVKISGPENNPFGYGTSVKLRSEGYSQIVEHSPYKGFMSSVSGIFHFGMGKTTIVDTLIVTWPDGSSHWLANVSVNQRIEISHGLPSYKEDLENTEPLFREVIDLFSLNQTANSRENDDFKTQPLLLHKLTANNQVLKVGDLDGNGLDDLFVGGNLNQPGHIFFQNRGGDFNKKIIPGTSCNSVNAVIFDANGDGLKDLHITCRGVGFDDFDNLLFIGNGTRNLSFPDNWLPKLQTISSSVEAADFDEDGDIDLFVGGFTSPQTYPISSRSFLFRNERGRFIDVTEQINSELVNPGIIRDALWLDYDNDGLLDLLICGEWMPIMLFRNHGDHFENVTDETGLGELTGWWQSMTPLDIDGDGDLDIICGNVGNNTSYEVSSDLPIRIYAFDLDNDGILDPITTQYINGIESIKNSRAILFNRQPTLNRRFRDHKSFATASVKDVVTQDILSQSKVMEARTFESILLKNGGNGKFTVIPLPKEAQLFPIRTAVVIDLNADGSEEIILGGSVSYETSVGESYGISGPVVIGLQPDNSFNVWQKNKIGLPIGIDIEKMDIINVGKSKLLITHAEIGGLKTFKFQ